MRVSIFVFDGVTALDAVGPYESLRRLPGVSTELVSRDGGPVGVEGDGFRLTPARAASDAEPSDVLIVPGGGSDGLRAVIGDADTVGWIRETHAQTRWSASVCTGALILGAAGLIEGLTVATHWRARDYLPRFGARYSGERITEQGRIITSAGVSAGIDMGLRLCELISGTEAAQAAQLSMEYDPAPPYDCGAPGKASDSVRELALSGFGG